MKDFWSRHFKLLVTLLVIFLLITSALAILSHYFPEERRDFMPSHLIQVFNNNHGTLTISDVYFIRSWMTFDYINTLFRLPPDYLKTQLNITDPHYPRISIRTFAKNSHVDVTVFLNMVQEDVKNFLSITTKK